MKADVSGTSGCGVDGSPASGPLVVGLVGRIAAGKSTVARHLAQLGANVIDADRIAHAVLDEPAARAEIVARFGAGVVHPAGQIDRRALAAAVFGPLADPSGILDLEAIVHPRVRRRITADLARLTAPGHGPGPRVIVLDVPLLVQGGWADVCDRILVVDCAESVRAERLAQRGWNAEEQAARDATWNRRFDPAPLTPAKTSRVDASGDVTYTQSQVESVWHHWLTT
jgi:dephospho-CoA kinase